MPKVSFVLPTFNRVAWISECIQSLRKQTEKDIEIIVVDDHSEDSTVELLKHFVKIDSRIKYVSNRKNVGAGMSRNIGNQIASSDIICVCDSDDYYPENRAEITLKFFKKNKGVDIMNGSYVRVDYSNNITEKFMSAPFVTKDFLNKEAVYFCHPSAAYLRKTILELPYRKENEKVTDDYQLLNDWANAGKKVKAVADILCYHRVLPNSMMTKMRGGSLI